MEDAAAMGAAQKLLAEHKAKERFRTLDPGARDDFGRLRYPG